MNVEILREGLGKNVRKKLRKISKGNGKLKPSKITKVFDIPVSDLIDSEENPNEMNDSQLDELVEGVKQEFDEPLLVMPIYTSKGKKSGKYIIASGHHRKKAAVLAGYREIPCIIKEGWDDDARKLALVRRNILRGDINATKFTKLYDDLAKRHDKSIIKLQMGFVEEKAFQKLYKDIADKLPAKQKKQLAKAKENIKSVDDLSSVLNTIFKEHGSELDSGFMVFSFGGKEHHYIPIDKKTNQKLKLIEDEIAGSNGSAKEIFAEIIESVNINSI